MQAIINFFVSLGVPVTIAKYIAVAQGVLLYFALFSTVLIVWMRRLPLKWEIFFQKHRLKRHIWRLFIAAYLTYYVHVCRNIDSQHAYFFDHLWTVLASVTTLLVLILLFGVINIAINIYETYPVAKRIPIRSYTQVLRILLGVGTGIIIASILLNQSPLAFFTGLGATVALVTFVFKDTISGFMASIQLSSYDMVRIGDIITVPKYNAEGTVLEVSLTTVKVQNFDKTTSMIPTSGLLTEGIKNWRGMFDSGGRRIKKALPIDMETIRFLNKKELSKLGKQFPQLIIDIESQITNLTLYRQFIEHFLRNNPDIHQEGFLFLIRELDPTENGLPLEFYLFTTDTNWGTHEKVQANILDFAIASLQSFDLKVFQASVNILQ